MAKIIENVNRLIGQFYSMRIYSSFMTKFYDSQTKKSFKILDKQW